MPPLKAYAADIAGSLAGIVAFGVLSAMREPPVVWLAVGFAALVLASIRDRRFVLAVGAVGAASLMLASWTSRVKPEFWSPYYRINLLRRDDGGFTLMVNGSLHQIMLPLDPEHAAIRGSYVSAVLPAYVRPYRYAARLDTALVVGAGTGNDLALLLQNGAKYIDAVEIDPAIADIGAAGHPKQPYSDPRVHRHINDARAFLRTTPRHYNVIVFGTLDSQTLLSGMSSVRLTTTYTVESFKSAQPSRADLAYRVPHVRERVDHAKLYQMIGDAFGEPPGVSTRTTFVGSHLRRGDGGDAPAASGCDEGPHPANRAPARRLALPLPDRPHDRCTTSWRSALLLITGFSWASARGIVGRRSVGGRGDVLHGRRLPARRDEERHRDVAPLRFDVDREPRSFARSFSWF
jgi:hypothetical protein